MTDQASLAAAIQTANTNGQPDTIVLMNSLINACTFSGNHAETGGGICDHGVALAVTNNTFVDAGSSD